MAEAYVAANTPNAGGLSGQQLQQQNMMARTAILSRSVNMLQQIYSNTVALPGSANNVFLVQPRLVGFLKRFYVEVTATVKNNGGVNALNLTTLGAPNIVSNFTFIDLANNTRHNTSGWHMHAVATAKRLRPFGCAFTSDAVGGYGNNFTPLSAPATIATGATQTVKMIYEVPVTYDDANLTGGIWMGVTNATSTLQITVNPTPGINTASDPTLAVYSSATASADAAIQSVTVTVYQNYLDQLPTDTKGNIVLPINDISTVYLLQNTVATGLVANQDNPFPYANARDFLSTFALFDNGGTLSAGTDIAYWAIQAANFINFQKADPFLFALLARNFFNTDPPTGMYYFNHRYKPISTIQFGNTQLVLNPTTVNTNAKLFVGYEMFALVNLIAQAGALSVGL